MNTMNAWRYAMGASILSLGLAAACGDSSKGEPSAQSGNAGAAQGGEPSGAGTAGTAGAAQRGGSSGGGVGGGAGTPEGGSDSAGSAGMPPSGSYEAMIGQLCPIESTIGVVQLMGFPTPYLQVTLYDRTDPWLGEAELSTPTCDFHHYDAVGCPDCEAGEVCSLEGACVAERRTIKDATLLVSSGADERNYAADPKFGGISSMLDIGDASSSFAMTLRWGEIEVWLDAMPVASDMLENAVVEMEGDYEAPGAIDATWDPSNGGSFVRTRIPINHHAAGPTFTECAAPHSAGSFHADAEMVNPLAVSTGLEFQGLEHVFIAAATTPQGCIEFRFGAQIFVSPT
jgi:hypothetical protein